MEKSKDDDPKNQGPPEKTDITDHVESINFLFQISDVDTSVNKMERFKYKLTRYFRGIKPMTYPEFDLSSKKIYNCCLKHIKDLHELHLKRCRAVYLLKEIIERANVSYIDTTHVVHLIWSIMSCIHHFQLRFRSGTNPLVTWTRRKKAHECMETYSSLIRKLPNSMYRIILNSLIIFYKEGRLWAIEFALTDLICDLLYLYEDIEEALEDILTTAEHSSLSSETEPRMLIKALYETLSKIKWSHMTEEMLRRFLVMLRKSIVSKPEYVYNYAPMRKGLNICLRNITRNLNNRDLLTLLIVILKKITYREMEDDTLLEFANIAEFAALRYKTQRFQTSFPDELIENVLMMCSSENPFHHFFGIRIMQNLLDRHGNRLEFEKPKIYFKGVNYNIKVAKFSTRDKIYFKKYRHIIDSIMLQGIKHHYHNRINLENMYSVIAVIAVEVPCAYVASSSVCFAMTMQQFILNCEDSNSIAAHHVHAIVMSIMSLVCYLHKAEVFYNYVTMIMERRSELAPQLNPPLKPTYKYAQHHILWNKPELFFEDWEARYGLWKCFRTFARKKKHKDHMHQSSIII